MPYRYGRTSQRRLATAHEYLQRLFVSALEDPACPVDITILCGHRTQAEQDALYAKGRTAPGPRVTSVQWPNSRHNSYPSLAVDAAPYVGGSVSWDWAHYHPLAEHVKATWARLKAEGKVTGELEWGGDWSRLKDGPHWQLNL